MACVVTVADLLAHILLLPYRLDARRPSKHRSILTNEDPTLDKDNFLLSAYQFHALFKTSDWTALDISAISCLPLHLHENRQEIEDLLTELNALFYD